MSHRPAMTKKTQNISGFLLGHCNPFLARTLPDLKNTLGAFHVSELFFVFGNEAGRYPDLEPVFKPCFGLFQSKLKMKVQEHALFELKVDDTDFDRHATYGPFGAQHGRYSSHRSASQDGPGGNLPLQGGAFGLGLGFTKQEKPTEPDAVGSID